MITTILDFINESIELNPLKWSELQPSEIVEFIEEILYSKNAIDITEKIAGQHLTVNIKNGFVTVSDKANIDNDAVSATKTKFGKPITTAIIEYVKNNRVSDVTWRFELVHPKHNHDYIKYKNTEIIAIEYTGRLDKVTTSILNSLCRGGKILCFDDVKVKFKQTPEFLKFKQIWETSLKSKIEKLSPRNRGRYYNGELFKLKTAISEVIDKSLLSVVDGITPVEGIVAKNKTNLFKLQTPNFLKLQKFQMTLYSLFKCTYNEKQEFKNEPNKTINDLSKDTGLDFKAVYSVNRNYSLYDTVKFYLESNSKIDDTEFDTNNYNKWLTKKESTDLLNRLNSGENVIYIFDELENKIK